ncbi:hypothetical protein KVT40_001499 [Elsinoe batatas]|uniref:Cryptic loci regulator 2 N-terminal domain-containing protein n=1 Tax=Elsinoe batatas TaxID=2601811 RepID=A0A8K0PF40_9PEZI|nr:hypothetical protein KVT40_001499 [Elsinoe batatas]
MNTLPYHDTADAMAPGSSQYKILPVCAASDGDRSRWPERGLTREDPAHYLNRLATKYMQEKGKAQNGEKYSLDQLPTGYALFGKRRSNDVNHVDRYLYGHESYKFRSAEEFYEHFRCLMDTGSIATCTCIACKGGRKRGRPKSESVTPNHASTRPKSKPKPKSKSMTYPMHTANGQDRVFMETPLNPSTFSRLPQRSTTPEYENTDEEGTPDIYRQLVEKLSSELNVDEPIQEPKSFDWQINRKSIVPFLKGLADQPSFQPRIGEIILFVRGLSVSQLVSFDNDKQTYVVWDTQQEVLIEMPPWEAGVVTEVPAEPVTAADLVLEQPKKHQVNYSGYRIEPMSAPNTEDKHWSKRVAMVRLHEMRPFSIYRQVHKGVQPKNFHGTVANALTVMSSFCLFEKYHFKGVWPDASVFCRGLFLGSEFLTIGDTVRLIPSANTPDVNQVWDVLTITSIKLRMVHLDSRDNPEFDSESGRWYDCCVHVDGIAFTRDQSRAWGMGKLPLSEDEEGLPACLSGYGSWYRLHDPKKRWKVPFSKILGRCFEADAMKLWFSSVKSAPTFPKVSTFAAINSSQGLPDTIIPAEAVDISRGLKDVVSARNFSRSRDSRITKTETSWVWAEDRADQLDLHEVKGQAVRAFVHGRPTRDIKAWKRAMKIREKGAGHRAKPNMSNVSFGQPSSAVTTLAGPGATEAEEDQEDGEESASGEDQAVASGPGDPSPDGSASDVEMAEAEEEKATIDARQIQVQGGDESSEAESEVEDLSTWMK